MAECGEVYAGPTYPAMHGARCVLTAPHDGIRHSAEMHGYPLMWWTPAEKEVIRQRNKEKNGNRP